MSVATPPVLVLVLVPVPMPAPVPGLGLRARSVHPLRPLCACPGLPQEIREVRTVRTDFCKHEIMKNVIRTETATSITSSRLVPVVRDGQYDTGGNTTETGRDERQI